MGDEETTKFFEEANNLKKLCDFLQSKHGPPAREALLMDKRILYLKGVWLSNLRIETSLIVTQAKSWSISWLNPKLELSGRKTSHDLAIDQLPSKFAKTYARSTSCSGLKSVVEVNLR